MTNPKKILIVEDNEKNMKLMRDLLQYAGYDTFESTTAEDALVRVNELRPDLILMDIQLPGMSGAEALTQLRANEATKRIPVVAVTASVMTHDRGNLISLGFDDYQSKPLEIKEFLDRVARNLTLDS